MIAFPGIMPLQPQSDRWVLVDNASTNGTYADGKRVARVEIATECVARLGHPADGPVLSCTVTGTAEGRPGRTLCIGRAPTTIFDKLGLADTPQDNRRVLAVLAFLRA